MANYNEREQQAKGRNNVTSVFISVLVGLAYSEMISPVRDSLRQHGPTLPVFALVIIFVATTLRFFIGAQLHLLSPERDNADRVSSSGLHWLLDFLVIFLESMIMIFMGGLCSLEENRSSHIGLIGLLVFLLMVDVMWIILVQWLPGKVRKSWGRNKIPWVWAVLNSCLIVLILFPAWIRHWRTPDLYSSPNLVYFAGINILAFIGDLGSDAYHLLRNP